MKQTNKQKPLGCRSRKANNNNNNNKKNEVITTSEHEIILFVPKRKKKNCFLGKVGFPVLVCRMIFDARMNKKKKWEGLAVGGGSGGS
jgi:hypothetical protein